MSKRSRLRTHGVRRRRLFFLFLALLIILGVAVWYGAAYRPSLVEPVLDVLSLEDIRTPENRDLVRGTIYDRNYKELAVSYERVSVYANIREIENLDRVVVPLAGILEESKEQLYDRLDGNSLRLWLARDISQEQEEAIRKLDLPGIFLHKEYVRYYPQQESAAHLIGFVEKDTGLSGIEYYLNELQTKHRITRARLDSLPLVGDGRPGADGRHLILTTDLKIQQILDRYLEKFSGKPPDFKAGALVMEAASGALIAYSQVPSFDPNRFHTYSEEVFTDIFNETMVVPEPFKIFLREVSLLESQSGHNRIPFPWSIVAEQRKLGVQLQLWEKLGAGNQEQYDFVSVPAEISERVSFDNKSSGPRDFETVPLMQTPLQILTAMARSVNGGHRVIPHAAGRYIVRRNQSEFLLENFESPPKGGLLHEGVSFEAQRVFRTLAVAGPINSAILEGKSVSYSREAGMRVFKRHNLLMALAPAHEPELILMVVASDHGYGPDPRKSLTLTDDVREIVIPIAALQKVMKNLADMMRPRQKAETNFHYPGGDESLGIDVGESGDMQQKTVGTLMPLLQGMSLRKSLRLLQGSGVTIEVQGSGRVVGQQPPEGSTLKAGSKVVLILERDEVDAGYRQDKAHESQ